MMAARHRPTADYDEPNWVRWPWDDRGRTALAVPRAIAAEVRECRELYREHVVMQPDEREPRLREGQTTLGSARAPL